VLTWRGWLPARMCRFPGAPLLAVGYSMGGLILTKFLGELGLGRWEPATGAHLPLCNISSYAAVNACPVLLWRVSEPIPCSCCHIACSPWD
jgi:hypothetical protein